MTIINIIERITARNSLESLKLLESQIEANLHRSQIDSNFDLTLAEPTQYDLLFGHTPLQFTVIGDNISITGRSIEVGEAWLQFDYFIA